MTRKDFGKISSFQIVQSFHQHSIVKFVELCERSLTIKDNTNNKETKRKIEESQGHSL
jgi:hypothetical protein